MEFVCQGKRVSRKNKALHCRCQFSVKAAYDFMDGMDEGDTIILGRGAKDEGDTRFAKAQSYSDKNNLGVAVEQPLIPMSSGNISGTRMRKFILAGDANSILENVPVQSESAQQKVLEILNIQQAVNENKKTVDTSTQGDGAKDTGNFFYGIWCG